EYLPDPIVPFRGSRFFQRTRVTADPDSTVIVGELLLPGRVARGEIYAYDLYRAETEARRPDGTLLFADVLRLCPQDGHAPRSLFSAEPTSAPRFTSLRGEFHQRSWSPDSAKN